jgi:hypothetical protein
MVLTSMSRNLARQGHRNGRESKRTRYHGVSFVWFARVLESERLVSLRKQKESGWLRRDTGNTEWYNEEGINRPTGAEVKEREVVGSMFLSAPGMVVLKYVDWQP